MRIACPSPAMTAYSPHAQCSSRHLPGPNAGTGTCRSVDRLCTCAYMCACACGPSRRGPDPGPGTCAPSIAGARNRRLIFFLLLTALGLRLPPPGRRSPGERPSGTTRLGLRAQYTVAVATLPTSRSPNRQRSSPIRGRGRAPSNGRRDAGRSPAPYDTPTAVWIASGIIRDYSGLVFVPRASNPEESHLESRRAFRQ